ncbi:hypothetical protein C2E23DRAFT_824310 [Lenzites betulinus]|nr:hypothetical protein C2E23DRAFT_824310 [Lenzites betulinus]
MLVHLLVLVSLEYYTLLGWLGLSKLNPLYTDFGRSRLTATHDAGKLVSIFDLTGSQPPHGCCSDCCYSREDDLTMCFSGEWSSIVSCDLMARAACHALPARPAAVNKPAC